MRSILKGGEVMDSGVSCHIHSLIEKNYIKRVFIMNKDIFVQLLGQRQFKAVRSILDVITKWT